jgi:hypothetical protein
MAAALKAARVAKA